MGSRGRYPADCAMKRGLDECTAARRVKTCDPGPTRPRGSDSTLPEAAMPTLHLPAAHTDTDVALAAEVASVVGSHELYVTWTHGEGPGLPPEIEAVTAADTRP